MPFTWPWADCSLRLRPQHWTGALRRISAKDEEKYSIIKTWCISSFHLFPMELSPFAVASPADKELGPENCFSRSSKDYRPSMQWLSFGHETEPREQQKLLLSLVFLGGDVKQRRGQIEGRTSICYGKYSTYTFRELQNCSCWTRPLGSTPTIT